MISKMTKCLVLYHHGIVVNCCQVFNEFLQYIYTGRVPLTQDTVLPLLMLADKYNVVDLMQVCCGYMTVHFVSTTRNNRSVSWYQYAVHTGHRHIADTCRHFIVNNFHKV